VHHTVRRIDISTNHYSVIDEHIGSTDRNFNFTALDGRDLLAIREVAGAYGTDSHMVSEQIDEVPDVLGGKQVVHGISRYLAESCVVGSEDGERASAGESVSEIGLADGNDKRRERRGGTGQLYYSGARTHSKGCDVSLVSSGLELGPFRKRCGIVRIINGLLSGFRFVQREASACFFRYSS